MPCSAPPTLYVRPSPRRQTDFGCVSDLVQVYKKFDVDAFACEFADGFALDLLEETLSSTHPIHPLGVEWAKQRGAYDDKRFAMIGLAQPQKRKGEAYMLERNEYGWSLDQVGELVNDPRPGSAGGRIILTRALVGVWAAHSHPPNAPPRLALGAPPAPGPLG